jgi:transcriptional regulator with XRE-family HTH domain
MPHAIMISRKKYSGKGQREELMQGLTIKIARIRHGCKQLEVARQTGINPTRLSKIENGWMEPRPEEVAAICAALNLDEQPNGSDQIASAA